VPRSALVAVAVAAGLALGPWLARAAARLGTGRPDARATPLRAAVLTLVLAGLLAGTAALTGWRPALLGIGWVAAAGVVLAAVDLAAHRLPDRVTYPAAAVCAAAFVADGAVTGSWHAVVRAVAALVWLAVPAGLGLGDVKLLALLGLVLGWAGWGVLLAGVFLGLVAGSVVSLALIALRRANWRTAVPFAPPLLAGAVLALAIHVT
jgi:leader peptidase (prepilin peptidase)/N-methyltransferase